MAELFVEMLKDGVHLVVHPSTVKSHRLAGWIVDREGVTVTKSPVDEEKTVMPSKPIPSPAKTKK